MIKGFCLLSNSDDLKIRGMVQNKILQGFSEIISPKTKFFFQGNIVQGELNDFCRLVKNGEAYLGEL